MKTLKFILLAIVGMALIGEYLYQSHEPAGVIFIVCAAWLGYCITSILEKKWTYLKSSTEPPHSHQKTQAGQ